MTTTGAAGSLGFFIRARHGKQGGQGRVKKARKEEKMEYLVTAREMQRYDENTVEKIGIPGMALMERAALAVLEAARRHVKVLEKRGIRKERHTALVLAGMGNNGADGLAAARLLCEEGFAVEVWPVGEREKASPLWKKQWEILSHYPAEAVTKPGSREYTVVIDALLGIGLARRLEGPYKKAALAHQKLQGYRIAVDLPSGVDADTGKITGMALQAEETVTFGFCKRGLLLYPGCLWAGKVTVADIGVSQAAFFGEAPGMFRLDEPARELFPPREKAGHKGTFGKVLLLAGSHNMAGAAVLAARAAYRSGAGMVKVLTDPKNRVILQETVPEALLGTFEDLEESLAWADVTALGPGLGTGKEAGLCLERVISYGEKPLILDADGLNLLAGRPAYQEALSRQGAAGRTIVLTPHAGELSRLAGEKTERVRERLWDFGAALAERLHAVVAAKDARSFVCAQGEPLCLNMSGNSGMATAGSGDVLTGILAAFLAQGEQPFRAVCAGVRLHGLLGDQAALRKGEYACMAGDLVEELERMHFFD